MSSFPPTLRLVAPRGMRGHPGLCSCARSGLHPGFWKGWWLCPCGGARGNEVFKVARAARNTLWELCALWKARTPLKECQDLLQDSETCRGFGLAPRLLWQERWGAQGVPNAPGMPVGEQPGWWQHPRAMAWGSNLGTAWNVGLEGLGSGQQGVQWLGSAGVHGHARASLLVCVQVCVALSFPLALGWGGLGMLSQDEALGWFLGLSRRAVPTPGARLASSCPQCLQIPLTPPAPCRRHCPSCARCQPPSHWEGSAPFTATSCPF